MENHASPSNEKITSGTHNTIWIDSCPAISYTKLTSDTSTDVVIVGGGISGVTIAYNLVKSGKKVVLLEDGLIGSGETGRTTAHIVSALDDRYYDLERIFGKENNKLIAASHAAAIDFVEKAVQQENIDCDFLRLNGYLFLHPSDDKKNLEKEFTACKEAGVNVEKTKISLAGKNHEAIQFNAQAQFHPLKYLKGLCDAIIKGGGLIYTNTHVENFHKDHVQTLDGFKVTAKNIVVATNSPVNNMFVMHLKQYPYRSYVIGLKMKKGILAPALWWDTGDYKVNKDIPPYHYVRTQNFDATHDLLIVGGEDHATGFADAENRPEKERYTQLEKWARENFSDLEEIVYTWSGQVLEPMDSLGYIGRNPKDSDNVYIVTGDSGNGMTHGTIAGMLIKDLIEGTENPWEKIYSPARFKLFKTGNIYIKELVGHIADYLKTKQKPGKYTLPEIPTDSGQIVEHNDKKFGVYRDENDNLHFVEPECTHQGCQVKWNKDEKTWDCPCHGSRFSYEGKVMNGPANDPLPYHIEKIEELQKHKD